KAVGLLIDTITHHVRRRLDRGRVDGRCERDGEPHAARRPGRHETAHDAKAREAQCHAENRNRRDLAHDRFIADARDAPRSAPHPGRDPRTTTPPPTPEPGPYEPYGSLMSAGLADGASGICATPVFIVTFAPEIVTHDEPLIVMLAPLPSCIAS